MTSVIIRELKNDFKVNLQLYESDFESNFLK